MMTYQEQLQHPNWKRKREHILFRDENICQGCNEIGNLHIHHKVYYRGKMAWEYPDEDLITLCKYCHESEHSYKDQREYNYLKNKRIHDETSEAGWYNLAYISQFFQEVYPGLLQLCVPKELEEPTSEDIQRVKRESREFVENAKNLWLQTNPKIMGLQ